VSLANQGQQSKRHTTACAFVRWWPKCPGELTEGKFMNKFTKIFSAVVLALTAVGIAANFKDVTRYVRMMRM
jgi:hypothetical protein